MTSKRAISHFDLPYSYERYGDRDSPPLCQPIDRPQYDVIFIRGMTI